VPARDWPESKNQGYQRRARGQCVGKQGYGDIAAGQPLSHDPRANNRRKKNAVARASATMRRERVIKKENNFQEQQPGAQQAVAGLLARTKALITCLHLSGQRIDVEALARQERPRLLDAVNTRWFDINIVKPALASSPRIRNRSMHRQHSPPKLHVFLIWAGTSPRTTTSDTAKRPSGLSTRNAFLQHAVFIARKVDDGSSR